MKKLIFITGYYEPFFEAILNEDIETMDLYIQTALDVNKEKSKQFFYSDSNALELAAKKGKVKAATHLCNNGALITQKAFEYACMNAQNIAEEFLKRGFKPTLNAALLFEAVEKNNKKAVHYLLTLGIDYTQKNEKGKKPLDIAIQQKKHEALLGFGECAALFDKKTKKRIEKYRVRTLVGLR